MSFVERFIILCPYLGDSTSRGFPVFVVGLYSFYVHLVAINVHTCVTSTANVNTVHVFSPAVEKEATSGCNTR